MKRIGPVQSFLLAGVGVVIVLFGLHPGVLAQEAKGKFGGKPIFSKTVLGKEYRIESVEGEAGKYWVYWGDEKMRWEPKPFYPDELNQKGPMFYVEYLNLKFFPFNNSLEEREQFTAFDVQNSGAFFAPFVTGPIDLEDGFEAHLYSPTGYRRDKTGMEFNKWYLEGRTKHVWDKDSTSGEPYRKYLFIFRSPQDLQKTAFFQVQYQGQKEDDNFLYNPVVRKVRRLATANRQDVIGGLVLRQEQNSLMTPIHNYKMLGSQLMTVPEVDPTLGFEGGEDKQSPAVEYKRVDGLGEPCWVYETTPFREDWWFAKQVSYVGLFTMVNWRTDSFDREGRLIQRVIWIQELSPAGAASKGVPEGRSSYLTWGGSVFKDYTTGFWVVTYPTERTLNPPLPETIYNTNTLLQEPKTVDFYRK
ncbi:MAG TPA: outer membrane lipoprotein-sorting protein [Candidatus Binatia bacterium]|jgi:hypothetical protein|nr:outer membrane lipoprotein-sorting protein [Candidatus Binatia bacterium]